MKTDAFITSPFDPYLHRLLGWGSEQVDGFTHPTIVHALVTQEHWQPAFAESVFTSARVRGLIGPYYGARSRGRVYWHVTPRGSDWLLWHDRPINQTVYVTSPTNNHPTNGSKT